MIKIKPRLKNEELVIFDDRRIEKVGNGACVYVPKEYIGKKALIQIFIK